VKKVRKVRKKRLIFSLLTYRNGAGKRARTLEVVAKVYGADRGGHALSVLKGLRDLGFKPPAPYRVPCPYGYLPDQCVLVQSLAPGRAWTNALFSGEASLPGASTRVAEWLLRLQECAVSTEIMGWERDALLVRTAADALAERFPRYAPRIKTLAERLLELLPSDRRQLVPSHGDFHPNNVFTTARLTTVIDFDTFGRREPAFDPGYAIGQLLIMSFLKTGSFAAGARAALPFWERYHQEGRAPWRRVAVQVARTFLQSLHYELCTLCNQRLVLLDLWPELIEEWLESGRASTLESLAKGLATSKPLKRALFYCGLRLPRPASRDEMARSIRP
jgi:hypothetical protein